MRSPRPALTTAPMALVLLLLILPAANARSSILLDDGVTITTFDQVSDFGDQPTLYEARRINAIGAFLVRVGGSRESREGELHYRFYLVEADRKEYRDAFSVGKFADPHSPTQQPQAPICVTLDMLNLCRSDDELAVLLAHEIGHTELRHADLPYSGWDVLGRRKDAYNREQERKADAFGLRLIARAGYKPHAAITLFERMGAGKLGYLVQWFQSHPANAERIKNARKLIHSLPPSTMSPISTKPAAVAHIHPSGAVTATAPAPSDAMRFEGMVTYCERAGAAGYSFGLQLKTGRQVDFFTSGRNRATYPLIAGSLPERPGQWLVVLAYEETGTQSVLSPRVISVAQNRPPDDGFAPFYVRFLAALERRDRATLRTMVAADVAYTLGRGFPATVDRRDAALDTWWPNLGDVLRALRLGFSRSSSPPGYQSPPPKRQRFGGWRAFFEKRGGRWLCTMLLAGD